MTTDAESMRDPVCGMTVTPATSVSSAEYEGATYLFCSEDCYRAFTDNPAVYAAA
jgi:YHS domain-containing protein